MLNKKKCIYIHTCVYTYTPIGRKVGAHAVWERCGRWQKIKGPIDQSSADGASLFHPTFAAAAACIPPRSSIFPLARTLSLSQLASKTKRASRRPPALCHLYRETSLLRRRRYSAGRTLVCTSGRKAAPLARVFGRPSSASAEQ